jgi:hypothetical protein
MKRTYKNLFVLLMSTAAVSAFAMPGQTTIRPSMPGQTILKPAMPGQTLPGQTVRKAMPTQPWL